MPERIQRKRTAGWRMPVGAVYVGLPSKWGNEVKYKGDSAKEVAWFRDMLARAPLGNSNSNWGQPGETVYDTIRRELGGKDLACWCALDQPCHADVLLEIANA